MVQMAGNTFSFILIKLMLQYCISASSLPYNELVKYDDRQSNPPGLFESQGLRISQLDNFYRLPETNGGITFNERPDSENSYYPSILENQPFPYLQEQSNLYNNLLESRNYNGDEQSRSYYHNPISSFSLRDALNAQSFGQSNKPLLVEPIAFSSNLDKIISNSPKVHFKSKLYDQLVGSKQEDISTETEIPTGYTSLTRGSRLSGGFRLLVGATERQCLDICLMTSYCLAVDYDTSERACYVHSTQSYCSGLFTAAYVNHYQRIPCIYGSVNRVSEVQYNYLVSGGEEVCAGCTLDVCLERCLESGQCQGVDFERNAQRCYFHSSRTLCSSFTPTSNVLHVSFKSCSGASQFSLSQFGYGSWFSRIRYMGPTKLPRGWLAYPGFRVLGGVVIAFNVSGDECASLCALHDTCQSFDYNTRDGSCWIESSEQLKCGSLIPTNDVYHAKKPQPCLYAYGTRQPYPYPTAVAL